MSGEPARPEPAYVLGHSARELERLAVQDRLYRDVTLLALTRAGLGPGLHVVDVGCGAGDVSLLAAGLVGPSGRVTGLDRSPDAVATASRRVADAGLDHVRFEVADLSSWAPATPVDAVVGRFVLMHQADPVALLARARAWLAPGGRLAFVESSQLALLAGPHSRPHSPTYDRIVRLWMAIIGHAGADLDMGRRLSDTFVAAGLPRPDAVRWTYESGERTSPIFRFAAESLRSMLPIAHAAGIAVPSADEMDGLEQALRDEVMGQGGVIALPPVVAAWTRREGEEGA